MKQKLLILVLFCTWTCTIKAQDIYEAAKNGNIKRLAQLVDLKKDTLNVVDAAGLTPLMAACLSNQDRAVQFLLDHGADVNVKTASGTALILAAKQNNLVMVQAIVVNEAKVDLQSIDGNTALIYAVINQNFEMVHFLLRSGANKNLSNAVGDTPMSIAKGLHNEQLMTLLMGR